MTAPVDVLAVLDAEIEAAMSACKSVHGSPRLVALYAARAAVDELLEAATIANEWIEDRGVALNGCRLRAALARAGGAP